VRKRGKNKQTHTSKHPYIWERPEAREQCMEATVTETWGCRARPCEGERRRSQRSVREMERYS
jgi:hypothetical protein